MRADLSSTVATAIDRCSDPSLVFDLARIEANLEAIASAAHEQGITVLFAAKSFPHPMIRELATRWLDGFDVASPQELEELPATRVISVADPSGRTSVATDDVRGRLIVSCETAAQVAAAPARCEIAIRLSSSLTGRDPAVGAVLDGSGHRRSRFGLDVDPARRRRAMAAMVEAAGGRAVGLHVHHGPVAATSGDRFVATARAALDVASDAGLSPRFLNVGGAWHAVSDLPAALAELRAAVPRGTELIIEPGRRITDEAGFACGRVLVSRELDDRWLRVVDLSRICHLRWSQIDLVGGAPAPGAGQPTIVIGPTCFEDDVLGEWTISPHALATGSRFVVRNVTGYAVAWNASFGGIAAARVVLA